MPVGFVQSPVILFDAATGKETVRLYGHHSVVNRIVFSPDGKRIYSGGHAASGHASTDGDLRIWDVEAKTELLAIRARDWALTPDGNTLAALEYIQAPQKGDAPDLLLRLRPVFPMASRSHARAYAHCR